MNDKDYESLFKGCLLYVLVGILGILFTGFIIGLTFGGDLDWIFKTLETLLK
jgi:hypothetical protein